ncbi:MAG: carbon monoxide dehydrogenase subunit G [Candidatus Promineofilum sp.]|nr:carbon monoxide dehydrogenase subunit G [Promineifilum sp.]
MVELVGEHEFAAPQELVWEMVMDPEVLAMTISGCEKLERIDENTLQGLLNLRVGPVQGIFQGKVESTDVHPPRSLHMIISGSGPAGVVRGEGNIILEALPTATRLRYDGAVQVSGRIASVGQRVMDSSAKSIVRQCLQNLERQIVARLEPIPELELEPGTVEHRPPSSPVLPVAPSQTEFALNVARDVIGDLIPQTRERSVLLGLGLGVAIVGFLNVFASLVARRVAKILREE